jgi:hypothetical protein
LADSKGIKMIEPTIGRVVLFHAGDFHTSDQVYPALVCKVWVNRLINVAYFNESGFNVGAVRIPLLQDDDPVPASGPYAQWMPYQKAQAEKANA